MTRRNFIKAIASSAVLLAAPAELLALSPAKIKESYRGISVGTVISVTGSSGSDGTYTVTSVGPIGIEVESQAGLRSEILI